MAECKLPGLILARLSNNVTNYDVCINETSLGGVSKRGMRADKEQKSRTIDRKAVRTCVKERILTITSTIESMI